MTTIRDVRDMLGTDANQAPRPKASKKKVKHIEKRPDGISRELFALMGERAPPIPIAQQPLYKAKRARNTPAAKWRSPLFQNEARADGLLLRHWRKVDESKVPMQPVEDNEPVPAQEPDSKDEKTPETGYRFAKYNLQIEGPKYDDTQYASRLETSDWTLEETNYLVDLVKSFYGKWPVIIDRYEYKPPESVGEGATQSPPTRTMEDLKARYYQISAKMMELYTPKSSMTAGEYENFNKMQNYNPGQEATRKKLKEALATRSQEEKREEEYLLAELRRIYLNQERFSAELKDIRQRLDHSLTDNPPDMQGYTTSAEISQLFQKVFARDRQKIPRKPNPGEAAASSPVTGGSGTYARGGSISGTGASGQKKGSAGQGGTQGHRHISARLEPRYGISTHDRLQNGVSWRSDKLLKARIAKSAVQTQKIASILTELAVPDLLQMPTTTVVTQMEKLVAKVNLLIDARKVREKEENELAILSKQKDSKNRGEGSAQPSEKQATAPPLSEKEESQDQADEEDGEAADDDEDEDEEEKEEEEEERDEEADDDNDDDDENGSADEDEDAEEDADGNINGEVEAQLEEDGDGEVDLDGDGDEFDDAEEEQEPEAEEDEGEEEEAEEENDDTADEDNEDSQIKFESFETQDREQASEETAQTPATRLGTAAQTRSKRSASVLSAASRASSKRKKTSRM